MTATFFSWAGAALFGLALFYGAYAYVIEFGRIAPIAGGWVRPLAVDAALFSVFALHHSLLARTGVKRLVTGRIGQAFERPLYVWVASVLFIICCWAWQPVPGVLYRWPDGWAWVAGAVQMAGLVVTLLAARRLDVRALAGLPSPATGMRPLETSGLYGVVRHPIYFGWILLVCATPVMTGTRAAFAWISVAYLAVAVPFEERALVAVYGDTYRAYQRAVRSRLVPGLY